MRKLPLNDPRWCPMQEAIQLRTAQLGDRDLAIIDLERAIESAKLRGIRWSRATGERERLTGVGLFDWFYGYGNTPDDWLYGVWKPDLDALFPVSQADPGAAAEAPRLPRDRAAAVLRDLYPTKARCPRLLKELVNAVAIECQKRNWPEPLRDSVRRAAKQLGLR